MGRVFVRERCLTKRDWRIREWIFFGRRRWGSKSGVEVLLRLRPFLHEVSYPFSSSLPARPLISIFPGLQDCPTSGLLWSMSIWSEPRPTRKSRSADALRKSADDPLIICTVARLFWAERKIEKARQWFERAVKINPDLGDVWAWWLRFERQHGTAVRIPCFLDV